MIEYFRGCYQCVVAESVPSEFFVFELARCSREFYFHRCALGCAPRMPFVCLLWKSLCFSMPFLGPECYDLVRGFSSLTS